MQYDMLHPQHLTKKENKPVHCSVCGKEYKTYPEAKACYDSHSKDEKPTAEKTTSPLDALNHLMTKKTEPVKRIAPKHVLEGEDSPQTFAKRLVGLAKDNDFNGKGRLTLWQARFELGDNSLQINDVEQLIRQYYPAVEIEKKPGSLLLLHFGCGERKVVSANTELTRK